MDIKDTKTTDGEIFTYQEACEMARLVFKRFGNQPGAASTAWNRMMEINIKPWEFMRLVNEDFTIKTHH